MTRKQSAAPLRLKNFRTKPSSNVARKGSQLEHRHDLGKFACRTPESYGFLDVDLFRLRERSRCGDFFSRSCETRPDELSPRSIREGTAGSSSAQGPPSQMAERYFSQINGGVKTHLTNSCGTNHKTLNAKPWQEGSAQNPRSRGDVVCVRAQRFLFGTHHE